MQRRFIVDDPTLRLLHIGKDQIESRTGELIPSDVAAPEDWAEQAIFQAKAPCGLRVGHEDSIRPWASNGARFRLSNQRRKNRRERSTDRFLKQ